MEDDNIAAAIMAGFTSAQLKDIDRNTTVPFKEGAVNRLNPMSFLNGKEDQTNTERQRIQDQINKEALERFPMPPPITSAPASSNAPQQASVPQGAPVAALSKIDSESFRKIAEASLIFAKAFDKVSNSLSKWLEKKTNDVIL